MRNQKKFQIETEKLGKKEITVLEVHSENLIEDLHAHYKNKAAFRDYLETVISHTVSGLTVEEFKMLYPSEKKILIQNLKTVNDDFFSPWPEIRRVIDKIGLVNWIIEVVKKSEVLAMMQDFMSMTLKTTFVANLKGDAVSVE